MLGVSAPGRWMLAIASRRSVERGRGTRRASAISSDATSRSRTNTAGGRDDEDDRDPAIEGQPDAISASAATTSTVAIA